MFGSAAISQSSHVPAGSVSRWTDLSDLLLRSSRALRDELGRFTARHGVSDTQFSLLWFCRQGPAQGVSQNEIAAALTLSPAHVSALVEQLRVLGLIDGQRDPADRRRQIWHLTEPGCVQLQNLLAELTHWAAQLDQRIPGERCELLAELLRDLNSTSAAPTRPVLTVFDPASQADEPAGSEPGVEGSS